MIELPTWAVPNAAQPALVDAGGVMRSPLGTVALRVDRPGSHYRVGLGFPPLADAQARILVARVTRAKREGLRVAYPLSAPQPVMGSPVVDGADQAGLSLAVRGLTPGQAVYEGYWLSIVAASGQRFLHNVAAQAIAGEDGKAVIALGEMLREDFADGAAVEIARPMIEGVVEDDVTWDVDDEGKVTIGVTVEEAA